MARIQYVYMHLNTHRYLVTVFSCHARTYVYRLHVYTESMDEYNYVCIGYACMRIYMHISADVYNTMQSIAFVQIKVVKFKVWLCQFTYSFRMFL